MFFPCEQCDILLLYNNDITVGRGALTPPHKPSAYRYKRRGEGTPPYGEEDKR